jgi:hypothetical protein
VETYWNGNRVGQLFEALVLEDTKKICGPFGYIPKKQQIFRSDNGDTEFDTITVDLVTPLPRFPDGFCISIKALTQKNPGSTCKLLSYTILEEIKKAYPYPTGLLLLGSAWKTRANSYWIKYASGYKDGKQLIEVWTDRDQYIEWLMTEIIKEPLEKSISIIEENRNNGHNVKNQILEGYQTMMF